MTVDDIAALFVGSRSRSAGQYQARCPAHDDQSPSLSMRQAGDRVLVFCHAGCSFEQITAAAGLTPHDWFDDDAIPASVRTARDVKRLEASSLKHRTSVEWAAVMEIGRELRKRDMEKLGLEQRFACGLLSEDELLDRLAPLLVGYAELEYEFQTRLARL